MQAVSLKRSLVELGTNSRAGYGPQDTFNKEVIMGYLILIGIIVGLVVYKWPHHCKTGVDKAIDIAKAVNDLIRKKKK